jgi:hypothetical protein
MFTEIKHKAISHLLYTVVTFICNVIYIEVLSCTGKRAIAKCYRGIKTWTSNQTIAVRPESDRPVSTLLLLELELRPGAVD